MRTIKYIVVLYASFCTCVIKDQAFLCNTFITLKHFILFMKYILQHLAQFYTLLRSKQEISLVQIIYIFCCAWQLSVYEEKYISYICDMQHCGLSDFCKYATVDYCRYAIWRSLTEHIGGSRVDISPTPRGLQYTLSSTLGGMWL